MELHLCFHIVLKTAKRQAAEISEKGNFEKLAVSLKVSTEKRDHAGLELIGLIRIRLYIQ